MQVDTAQERVIIQHFLKVRHKPFFIGGVAVKAAAQLVVDTTIRHTSQRVFNDFEFGYFRWLRDFAFESMLLNT